MLYRDWDWEIPYECLESARHTREQLTGLVASPDISPGLAQQVKLLRSYFRTFMDTREDHGRRYHMGADPFSVALGELRAKVGQIVGDVAARFDLEVEGELASIVPIDRGGFFDRVLTTD